MIILVLAVTLIHSCNADDVVGNNLITSKGGNDGGGGSVWDIESELEPELRSDALAKRRAQAEEIKKREAELEKDIQRLEAKRAVLMRVLQLKKELATKKSTVEGLIGELGTDKKMVDDRKQLVGEREKVRLNIAEERKAIENDIVGSKNQLGQLQKALKEEEERKSNLDNDALRLAKEKEALVRKAQALAENFKMHGFETWMESNVNMFPDVVRATLFKTGNILEPLVEAVEEAAEVNERLTEEVAQQITQYIPLIRKSPFYSGILFYVILLFPLVLSVALVLRVNSRLFSVSVNHYIIVGNLYFGAMSVVCFFMSILSGTDILIVFQHRSSSTAETFMVVNAFLYLVHLFLHGLDSYTSKSKKTLGQLVCALSIGMHFYSHAYKRAILHQDPHIGAFAYFLYSGLFLYTLYDRGVDLIETQITRKNRFQYTNGDISRGTQPLYGTRTYYHPATGASTADAARYI